MKADLVPNHTVINVMKAAMENAMQLRRPGFTIRRDPLHPKHTHSRSKYNPKDCAKAGKR